MQDLTTITIETPTLGDRSYLVHDGDLAFVVDPQRDIDRVLALVEREDVRLASVFETHVHNDYVTGGLALARRLGADYHVNAKDPVAFERVGIEDGQVVEIGDRMRVTALATPGHTYTHLSYALSDRDRALDRALSVFSGGSLLYGATGRPDLLGPDHTDALVRLQHGSARMLGTVLPAAAELYPTHGFGSFCSATQSEATSSTIGQEWRLNPALLQSQREYVRDLLAGLDEWPSYYAAMSDANLAGPDEPDLSAPSRVSGEQIRARIAAGEWVVDMRPRTEFSRGHVPGTVNFGLDGSFATYLGWLHDRGTPLTLLASTGEDVANAQRELVRLGVDRIEVATGGPQDWGLSPDEATATIVRADFKNLGTAMGEERAITVLDVRRVKEYAESHIDGSLNIPLQHLRERLDEVPEGEVWVHCAGGYRASIGASLLGGRGRVVAVDDSFDNAAAAGLPLTGSHPGIHLANV